MSANSDQIMILLHNFYFYVMDGKFFYVSWDYNQVLFDITASPIPGYEMAKPWYAILCPAEKKRLCPYNVPSSHDDLSQRRFKHFTCDPVGFTMARAWKHRWLKRVRALDTHSLVKWMEDEVCTR